MKTLKQIREEYEDHYVSQVDSLHGNVVLEDTFKPKDVIPSSREMPSLLVFRRVSFRSYPKGQVVALYYSKTLDKYLSIPFGPDGNLNLSESIVLDSIDEGIISKIVKPAAAGFTVGAGVGALPGAVAGTLGGLAYGAGKAIKDAKKDKANKMDKKLEESEVWTRKEGQSQSGGLNRKCIEIGRAHV